MFYFNEFLERHGFNPSQVRLLRHKPHDYSFWFGSNFEKFGCYASFQKKSSSPYAETSIACHFLPTTTTGDGLQTALYIGTTRILDRWDWDGKRKPKIFNETIVEKFLGNLSDEAVQAFDLEWLDEAKNYSERVVVKWGSGTRAWSQWADRNNKEIIEIRSVKEDREFPGFSRFIGKISELSSWPPLWIEALGSVGGVYLLVAQNGEQYIGSAVGKDGFLGRWKSYFINGHGGNKLLKKSGFKDYNVSILEITSDDMSMSDVIKREAFWKTKLGTKAHGLNAN